MHLGKRLRQERLRRHLSQEALAEALNISPRSVRRWEQGQALPQASMRLQLSRFFEIPPAALSRGGGPLPKVFHRARARLST